MANPWGEDIFGSLSPTRQMMLDIGAGMLANSREPAGIAAGMGLQYAQQQAPQRAKANMLYEQNEEAKKRKKALTNWALQNKGRDPLADAYFNGTVNEDDLSKAIAEKLGGGTDEYGVTGIYTTDPETGELGLGQLSKSGGFKPVDLKGRKLAPGTEKIDLGTEWGVMDRAGNLISRYPKDIAGEQRQQALGKGQGEADVAHTSMQSKMPGLEQTVTELDQLAEQATYTLAGRAIDEGIRQTGFEPRASAVARSRYIAIVDNQILPLLRDTFGAQFTEREGQSLKATLGDPNKSPKEKQAVLKAFIEQKRRDVEALAVQSGRAPTDDGGGWVEMNGVRIRRKSP